MKTSIKKLAKSQVEIEVEIDSAEFDHYFEHALKHAKEHVNVDGFRKGNVPESIVAERVGENNLLADAADAAVDESYAKVIEENQLEPLAKPEIQVLKLARGNPFIFKVNVAVLPEIELADYKKIASQAKKQDVSVKDEDVDDTLNYVRKSRAKFSPLDRPAQEKDFVEIEYESSELPGDKKKTKDEFVLGEAGFIPGFEKNIIGMKAGEEKEFTLLFPKDYQNKALAGRLVGRASPLAGKDVAFKVKLIKAQSVELPELNDEFAKHLGNFENITALKRNIKEGIMLEKEEQEKQRKRNEIIEAVSEKSKMEVPEVLIILEKERLFKNFQDRIAEQLKITFQDYLNSVKQDENGIKDSFAKEAEKKVKSFLVIKEIGKKENISVGDKELEEEMNKTIKNYPADVIKKIDINQLKEYTKGVIYNEKVFLKLEGFIIQ